MATSARRQTGFTIVAENLFNFAIDRDFIKGVLEPLAVGEKEVNRITVEYELQILRIVGVGWGISFFMEAHPCKQALAENYWAAIENFSQSISQAAALTVDSDIDYFQTLKNRLDRYVGAMERDPAGKDPVAMIGPEFARVCSHDDNVYVIMASNRVFSESLAAVKEYIDSVDIV
jgi:hypothetical protein